MTKNEIEMYIQNIDYAIYQIDTSIDTINIYLPILIGHYNTLKKEFEKGNKKNGN